MISHLLLNVKRTESLHQSELFFKKYLFLCDNTAFLGTLGPKMGNLLIGQFIMTEFLNNQAEERWSSNPQGMKMLVS